jgi:CBS-domain-containing membrane protein
MVSLTDLFEAAGVSPGQAQTSGPWHRYEHVMSRSTKRVADAMSHPVATVPPDASVAEVAGIMRQRDVNRVPVVEADGRVLGIVAREDIIDAVVRAVQDVRPTPGRVGHEGRRS